MNNLSDIATVKEILTRHGFRFSKSLGQNFLINPTVCPRMAELGGAGPGVAALEVGPGIGVLTRELAARCDKVVTIELDKRLLPVLGETLQDFSNVTVVQGNVMQLDLSALFQQEFAGRDVIVCANLPYYITSPVIMRFLEERLPIRSLTVMVQKEAAQRLCARPGERACGAVSAAVRYYAEPKVLFSVSRGSFMPAPHVDSAVIRLDIRQPGDYEHPLSAEEEKQLFRVVRAAFGQRRKTAVNSLSAGLSMDKARVIKAMEQAGLPPAARAEQLTLDDFEVLSQALFTEE